ncbi:SDR family oxidoreductase [Acidipropionibacterium virtanenii]|uniref:3-oxoacyl-[acyl-carrier-protein] reductase FabG n=1 Tax=Acidipropionibacterium virtanenii TaxID=2057246 RepID=A0A344UPM5_9ACTN|nr:SDR family oxidoreductase [Acidipropionibacterium virtanenii]AXE37223.1 3-oxoacyl-[acyl-carrier-protein] reductase FabG [Acidipropionibacterium virtanenii]
MHDETPDDGATVNTTTSTLHTAGPSAPDPLAGRTVLVTGVSRRRGIGFGIASALADAGARLVIHHFAPHDADQPWGSEDVAALLADLDAAHPGCVLANFSFDLARDGAAKQLIRAATERAGRLHGLVCNHARSGGDGSLFDVDEAMLDGHWRVNARSTILLTRYFAEQFEPRPAEAPSAPGQRPAREPHEARSSGRVVWLTSGQIDSPMPGEVAYATSKAALAGVTKTVCAELLSRGVALNTINPGPVNTGYMDPETADRPLDELRAIQAEQPFGRFGTPGDIGRLVAWLMSPASRWVVGQVISSDGGFSLG